MEQRYGKGQGLKETTFIIFIHMNRINTELTVYKQKTGLVNNNAMMCI
jgi:hypothetical protein